MIDTYLCSGNADALRALCSGYLDVIGPMPGRPASTDGPLGDVIPGVGDPEKFYACIRYSSAVVPPEGVELCDAETGAAVVGIWANGAEHD